MPSIFLVSDLHSELYTSAQEVFSKVSWSPADILVLAGDIGNIVLQKQIYKDLLTLCKAQYKDVIVILGNHEYYHCDFDMLQVRVTARLLCNEVGVTLLDRESLIIQGIRFVGATLWSIINAETVHILNDMRQSVFPSQIEYVAEFIKDFTFIQSELEEHKNDNVPTIVITHHLPSNALIHPRFMSSAYNSAFVTDILDRVELKNVLYWFCGHTHEHMNRLHRNTTRLVVNPVGYPKEPRATNVSKEVFQIDI